jgi:uncharacterized protein (TIGR03905 family)
MHYTYQTENTCSSQINFDLNEGIVSNVTFTGGCNGNLKAIPALIEGLPARDVARKLSNITCGRRPTSCADQLARALNRAMDAKE